MDSYTRLLVQADYLCVSLALHEAGFMICHYAGLCHFSPSLVSHRLPDVWTPAFWFSYQTLYINEWLTNPAAKTCWHAVPLSILSTVSYCHSPGLSVHSNWNADVFCQKHCGPIIILQILKGKFVMCIAPSQCCFYITNFYMSSVCWVIPFCRCLLFY